VLGILINGLFAVINVCTAKLTDCLFEVKWQLHPAGTFVKQEFFRQRVCSPVCIHSFFTTGPEQRLFS
jgi:hypothetical protein